VRNGLSKALEKEADKLLKAYSVAEKWNSNRQNKSTPNVTKTKNKGLPQKNISGSV